MIYASATTVTVQVHLEVGPHGLAVSRNERAWGGYLEY